METNVIEFPTTFDPVADRNARKLAFHKADRLCKKIETARANGQRVDPVLAEQALAWRTATANALREVGSDELDPS